MPLLANIQNPIGGSGLNLVGSQLWRSDEYNVDLASPQSAVATYEQMRRGDAQVRATINNLLHALRAAQWRIDPAEDNPKGEEHAAFVRSVLMPGETYGYGGSTPWGQTLRNLSSAIWAGPAVVEKVWGYRTRDRKQVYASLELRKASSLRYFDLTKSGPSKLDSVVQYVQKRNGTSGDVRIPAAKLVVWSFNREGDNFWGESILRPAHWHWRVKRDLVKFDAIQKERAGGIFWLQTRENVNPTPDQSKSGKSAMSNWRMHEREGLIIPSVYEFNALFPSGNAADFITSIEYHDQQIERTAAAQFQSLGTGNKGALAVGSVQSDMMLLAYQGVAKDLEDVLTEQAIVDLIDTNFGEQEFYPRLACESFLQMKPDRLAELMGPLVAAGLIRIDQPLRVFFRERLGLTPEDESTLEPSPADRAAALAETNAKATADAAANAGRDGANGGKGSTDNRPPNEATKRLRKASYPGPFLRRDPLAHEVGTDWLAMKAYLDDEPKRLYYREVLPIRKLQIAALADSVSTATEAQLALGQIPKPQLAELGDALAAGLADVYATGRSSVVAEAKRAKATKAVDPESTDATPAQSRWVKRLGQRQALDMTTTIWQEAINAGQLAQDQELPTEDKRAAVLAALTALSTPLVIADLAGTVNQTFTTGRVEQADRMQSQIAAVYYSAIMDDGTCDACAAMDGAELDLADYGSQVPNPNCDYPPRCRCTAVFSWRADQQEAA